MNRSIEILLIEDNPADVELTLAALRRNNLANEIHICRDGEEALGYLFAPEQPLPEIKLVLLDLKLPKIDGLQVLRAIKSDPRTRKLPVVVLTSSREERDLINSYDLGVNSYIQKPVDFDQFRDVVKRMGFYWLLINQTPPQAAGDGEARP